MDVLPDREEESEEQQQFPIEDAYTPEELDESFYPYPYYDEEEEEEEPPSKRQMLSMMPGLKRAESFYPYHDVDQDPWMALIPQAAASKRAVQAQYDHLYSLAQALRRERRADTDQAWDRLMAYYERKK